MLTESVRSFQVPATPRTSALAAELAFGADLAGDAGHFGGEGVELVHHGVDGVLELHDLALDVDGDLLGEVAVGDGGGDLGDVADLGGEVAGHEVDGVGEVLPGAGDALDVGLSAELALGAYFAGHAGHFGGEGAELVHHGVDGALELEELALDVDGDLLGEVARGDGCGDLGDVADLGGEVAGHGVDGVGEVLPGAGDALDLGLAAELAFGAYLAGHAGDFGGEGAELLDHLVDGLGGAEELALEGSFLDLEGHGLGQVALGDGADDAGGLADGVDEVADEVIDGVDGLAPGAAGAGEGGALGEAAFFTYDLAEAGELLGHLLVEFGDVVEGVGDLAGDAGPLLGGDGWRCPRRGAR